MAMFIGLLVTGCVATLPPVLGGAAGADAAQRTADNFCARRMEDPFLAQVHDADHPGPQNIGNDIGLQRLHHVIVGSISGQIRTAEIES